MSKQIITCPCRALSDALGIVSSVVPSKTTKEIVKNIKLIVKNDHAILIATDTEIGIRHLLPLPTPSGTWEALLPPRIVSILREIGSGDVTLTFIGNGITVTAPGCRFELATESPAEFPDVKSFNATEAVIVNAASFAKGIRNTVFAVDLASTRFALAGVCFDARSGRYELVATDSRRLAMFNSSIESDIDFDTPPVVPAKTLLLLERTLPESGDLMIDFRLNEVAFQCGQTTITSVLIAGRFPRYRDVIPTEFNSVATVTSGPLLSALRKTMLVTNEESVGVEFRFTDGNLNLNSKGTDVGNSTVDVPISLTGPDVIVSLQPKLIADFLKCTCDIDPIEISLIDEYSAVLFRVDESYSYVVMPLAGK